MARILVIDDEALIRDTIKAMLEMENHEVLLAPHGEEALREFQAQPVNLVICDLFTTRTDGMETVSAIRRLAAEVPIIAMAGGTGDAPLPGDVAPSRERPI